MKSFCLHAFVLLAILLAPNPTFAQSTPDLGPLYDAIENEAAFVLEQLDDSEVAAEVSDFYALAADAPTTEPSTQPIYDELDELIREWKKDREAYLADRSNPTKKQRYLNNPRANRLA